MSNAGPTIRMHCRDSYYRAVLTGPGSQWADGSDGSNTLKPRNPWNHLGTWNPGTPAVDGVGIRRRINSELFRNNYWDRTNRTVLLGKCASRLFLHT